MTEPKERSRSTFEDVAKLAALPEPTRLSDDEEENSGMIDLAAIAAGDRGGKRTPSVRPPSATSGSRASTPPGPPERGQRLTDPIDTGAPPPVRLEAALSAPLTSLPAGLIAQSDAVSGLSAPFPPAPPALNGLEAAVPPSVRSPSPDPPPSTTQARAGLDAAAVAPAPGVAAPARSPSILPPAPAVLAGAILPPVRAPMPSSANSARTPLALETARPTALSPEAAKGGGGALVWLGVAGGMGLGALLTAGFLHLHAAQSAQLAVAASMAAAASETAAPSEPPAAEKEVTAPTPPPAPTARQPGPAMTARPAPIALPPHPAGVATAGRPASTAGAAPVATAAAPSAEALDESPPSGESPPAANEAASAASPAGADPGEQSLEALMRKAVNGSSARPPALPTAASPAAASADTAKAPSSPGNVPLKPSMGAVQGAVGAVLPAARYCLGPDDPISHATLVFKSDGSVQSVAITGDAAGQPAEACIRSRLLTARVPPFANPTFTWTVTVRPASQ